MYFAFLIDLFHQYSIEWEGPFFKKWGNKYWKLCDDFKDVKVQTVQECKQICENESGCNILIFRNVSMTCNLRKCPTPVHTPNVTWPEDKIRMAYFLPGKRFKYTNVALIICKPADESSK